MLAYTVHWSFNTCVNGQRLVLLVIGYARCDRRVPSPTVIFVETCRTIEHSNVHEILADYFQVCLVTFLDSRYLSASTRCFFILFILPEILSVIGTLQKHWFITEFDKRCQLLPISFSLPVDLLSLKAYFWSRLLALIYLLEISQLDISRAIRITNGQKIVVITTSLFTIMCQCNILGRHFYSIEIAWVVIIMD